MQQIHSRIWHLLRIALALLALEPFAFGQITNVTDDQSTPIPGAGHDYIGMVNETVNPANGSVSIRIGVPVPPSRGLTLPFAFAYDSNGAMHAVATPDGTASWMSNTGFGYGGWSNTLPMLSWSYRVSTSGSYRCDYVTDFVFQDPTGGRHFFGMAAMVNLDGGCTQAPVGNDLAGADDFYYAVATSAASLVLVGDRVTGTAYSFSVVPQVGNAVPSSVEDRNGNKVIISAGPSSTTVKDTLERTLTVGTGTGSPQSVQLLGLGAYEVYWVAGIGTNPPVGQTADAWNSQRQYCTQTSPVQPYGVGSTGVKVIDHIVLPNGEKYQFAYDGPTGLLKQITYPDGGWVKYTWDWNSRADHIYTYDTQHNQGACGFTYDVPAVKERQVSFNGTAVALDQTFGYTTDFSAPADSIYKTTTVTTNEVAGTTTITKYEYTSYSVAVGPYDGLNLEGVVPIESSITYKDGSSNVVRVVNKAWSDQTLMTCESNTQDGMTSRTDYNPGAGLPWTNKSEWDWGQPTCGSNSSGAPLRQTQVGTQSFAVQVYPASEFAPYAVPHFLRPTTVTTSYNGAQAAQTTYHYDESSLSPGGAAVGRDNQYNGGTISVRGNATSKSEWLNTTGGSVAWSYSYDDTGQEVNVTDPNGNETQYSYTDAFQECNSPAGNTNAYLTQITDAKLFTQSFTYRFCDGQLHSATDRNGKATTYAYESSLNRLHSTTYPDTGSTTYGYGSNACGTPSSTDTAIGGGSTYHVSATLDGVCHVTQTALNDPENTGSPIKTDTAYDGWGRVWTVSNPYHGNTQPANILTTYAYDPLGRTASVTYPDTNVASTSYYANTSTVIDAGGKKRLLLSDALGRLNSVTEDPDPGGLNYPTVYFYDGLDNLLTVSQSGQSRGFTYDSLSRLLTSTNPESGQIGYSYDGDGNVISKTDAHGTTTYGYDALNRLLYKNYEDSDTSTVRACYAYDGLGWTGSGDTFTNALGHLTASWGVEHDGTVVAASEFYQFDTMGRVQEGRQCTPATCGATNYPVQTGYDLMGHQINLWESSVARYSPYDAAARLAGLSASLNVSAPALSATGPGTQALLNISAHSPFGGLASATLGNGLAESRSYTNRGWLGSIAVGSVYSLNNANNPMSYAGNGNVISANDSENGNWSYSSYDGVNRLKTATNNTTGQTFNYSFDPWGNMTCAGSLPCTPQGLAFNNNPQNNRITTAGYSYDLAGNLVTDNTHGYTYDAENRLTCVWGTDGTCTSASAMLYLYDADGRRVGKQHANTLEDYVYDPQGNISSVHDGAGNLLRTEFYPPDGRHVATLNGNTWNTSYLFWNHADWLGTERVRTNSGGTATEWCSDIPYGMNLTCNNPNDDPMHFTGKQRDAESNLDYFGARYNESVIGRLTSPDPSQISGSLARPQTWNRYVYAINNPLRFVDDGGLDAQDRVNRAALILASHAPYVTGGHGDQAHDNGYDCEGLCFASAHPDVNGIPFGTGNQYLFANQMGDFSTDLSQVQPGDEVFFATSATNGAIAHVGVVVAVDKKTGQITIVHAAGHKAGIIKSTLSGKAGSMFGDQPLAGYALWHKFDTPATGQAPNQNPSGGSQSNSLWNWFENLFFNQTPSPPPPSPKPQVTSFFCGGPGEPPCAQ